MWRGHELFASSLPMLVEYIPVTLFYFLTPTIISLFLGALLCKIRTGKKNLSYYLASLFVSFFRGTPGLVQIYIIFFGLPKIFEGFGMEVVEKTEEKLEIHFHYCPYVTEWVKQGRTPEEIANLCEVTMEGDHEFAKAFPGLKFELKGTIADGLPVCTLCFTKRK